MSLGGNEFHDCQLPPGANGLAIAAVAALVLAVGVVVAGAGTAWADPTSHSITIKNTNSNISINGEAYTAYKLFDSTHSGDAYAYTLSTSSPFYSADLTTEFSGSEPNSLSEVLRTYFRFATVSGDSTVLSVSPKNAMSASDARAFADAIQSYISTVDTRINTNSSTMGSYRKTSGEAANETATIQLDDDDAGLGYYIVTGGATATDGSGAVQSAVMITNEDPTPQINPKAGAPTLDKTITGVQHTVTQNTTADTVISGSKAATASPGDTVNFKLSSQVPNLTGYTDYTYVITDQLSSGLDFVGEDNVVVRVGENTLTHIEPTATAEAGQVYVSVDAETRTLTVRIPYITLKGMTASGITGTSITVEYGATVNKSSLDTNFEDNKAQLEYSNNPYGEGTGKTTEKHAYVIDFDVDVNKVTSSPEQHLAGAKFRLTKLVNQQTYYYKWDSVNGKVSWQTDESDADEFVTGEDGTLYTVSDDGSSSTKTAFRGLEVGTYHLIETEAPKGYTQLASDIVITVSANIGAEGDEANKVVLSATVDDQPAAITNNTVDISAQQNANHPVASVKVVNNAGSVLPSTGGMGTTAFYVVGGLLVVGAIAYLVHRRKANANA